MEAVLRGKFIALIALSHTNNLTATLKALEQKEANTPNNRQQEIIELGDEIKN